MTWFKAKWSTSCDRIDLASLARYEIHRKHPKQCESKARSRCKAIVHWCRLAVIT